MDKSIADMQALVRKQSDELEQLRGSLTLQRIWPEVFASGQSVSTRWIGLPLSKTGGRRAWRFEVTANGETRCFEPGEVAPAIKPPEATSQHVNVRARTCISK